MSDTEIRQATVDDLGAIVALLADDALGSTREQPDDIGPYQEAFHRLARDPNQHLVVAEQSGVVVGTLQLTIIHGLSLRASTRGQVEAVRVSDTARSGGIGTQLMEWAIDESRRQGCWLVQLTSNAARLRAHQFYERLGFTASHTGFKMALPGEQ